MLLAKEKHSPERFGRNPPINLKNIHLQHMLPDFQNPPNFQSATANSLLAPDRLRVVCR